MKLSTIDNTLLALLFAMFTGILILIILFSIVPLDKEPENNKVPDYTIELNGTTGKVEITDKNQNTQSIELDSLEEYITQDNL